VSQPLTFTELGHDPEQLELRYRRATAAGEDAAFAAAVDRAHAAQPDDPLYAAWHYRFAYAVAQAPARSIAWATAAVLGIINGALLWGLSDPQRVLNDGAPEVVLFWAPISAVMVLLFLAWTTTPHWPRLALSAAAIVLLAGFAKFGYVWLDTSQLRDHYLQLMLIHMPLLAWAGVGLYLVRPSGTGRSRTFFFLLKSLEVFIVAGLFAIAGGVFVAVTIGLFSALGIELDEWIVRVLVAGGGGLLPLLAVAIVYDPAVAPNEQSFSDGLSRLIALLMRVLLPLTLLVLLVYLAFIPFNFWAPFENRDVLIVYSGMLFAVMAMLVGATPPHGDTVAPQTARWLRRGLTAVALTAAVVGLYALAAIGYRTWQEGWTPNRLAFVGWNAINVGILAALVAGQILAGKATWLTMWQRTLGRGALVYAVWTVVVIVALPLLF
jgi:hypothetical protein